MQLEVVKHTEAKRGFILLPRRWVVERRFARAASAHSGRILTRIRMEVAALREN
jgi:transposase